MKAVKQTRSYYCGPASLRALQLELGRPEALSQDEWAKLARTTSGGTSIAGMKRCIKIISPNGFTVVRKTEEPFGVGIVYCWDRDHWMVARSSEVGVKLVDPEDGSITMFTWPEFQKAYMNSSRNSYVLAVKP